MACGADGICSSSSRRDGEDDDGLPSDLTRGDPPDPGIRVFTAILKGTGPWSGSRSWR